MVNRRGGLGRQWLCLVPARFVQDATIQDLIGEKHRGLHVHADRYNENSSLGGHETRLPLLKIIYSSMLHTFMCSLGRSIILECW